MTRLHDAQARLLEVAAPHLAEEGFSHRIIDRAAKEAGLDPVIVLAAFPRGIADLARYFIEARTAALIDDLAQHDLAAMKVRARIALAVTRFFQRARQEREIYRRLVHYYALPSHTAEGIAATWHIADRIWLAAGDRATDFNHYSKRLLLSAILSSTQLIFLQDDSETLEMTLAFIDRRIDDVMQIEKVKANMKRALPKLDDLVKSLGRARYAGRPPMG